MMVHQWRPRMGLGVAVLLAAIIASTGCSTVGPASIKAGRGVYNEAINQTEAQQTLMTLVRNRYGETSTMLAVTSVTANVRVSTNAGINLGFGTDANYSGNLVPFSGGVVYEENPTISYVPVQGEKYMRQLMSPIPLNLLVPLVRSRVFAGPIYTLLVGRVNEINNPDFLSSSLGEPNPRFSRFVQLMTDLSNSGVVYWVENLRKEAKFSVVIRKYAPAHLEQVHELLDLLGLPKPANDSRNIILPTFLAVEKPKSGGIALETRSIWGLTEILTSSIAASEEDIRSGLVGAYPPAGLAGRDLHIHRSEGRPDKASVAMKYRGTWFYIDETDQATKTAFWLLHTLHSVIIAEAAKGLLTAPVLTVPVSR